MKPTLSLCMIVKDEEKLLASCLNSVKDVVNQMVIYNILGHAVRQIISETQTAGFKSVVWDGKDDVGKPVGAGVYLYKISSGNHLKFNKMVLLK